MAEEKKELKRRKMVVEEVGEVKPEVTPSEPLVEIKEKAHEIEDLADVAATPVEPPVAPYQEQYFPPTPSSKGLNPLFIIIPGIFLLGGLLGGIVFYQSRISGNPSPTGLPSETPLGTPIATSTPTPTEVDVTKYNISILNGSGIKGEAGKAQALLEKGGFKISSTGNASNYGYTKTVIQAKSEVDKDFLTKLSETLGETYLVDTKTQALPSSSKDTVVVIVGTSKE